MNKEISTKRKVVKFWRRVRKGEDKERRLGKVKSG